MTEAHRALRKRQLKWFYGGGAGLAGVFALLLAAELVQRSMVA